jgi:hypothetical protein
MFPFFPLRWEASDVDGMGLLDGFPASMKAKTSGIFVSSPGESWTFKILT